MDADNTILDTNNHFWYAQREMLTPFEEAGFVDKNDEEEMVEELREIDMEIAEREGENEYDFKKLSRSLYYYHVEGISDVQNVAELREEPVDNNEIVDKSTERFYDMLNSNHELVENFEQVYSYLKDRPYMIVVFSEGEAERIRKELAHHEIDDLFDDVFIGEKDEEEFNHLVTEKLEYTDAWVVGDSLERDIGPAKRAGFTTVHHPAGFEEDTLDIEPDYRVEDISELTKIL